ncbi:discoidin domain-containing protein [Priestia megaterium]
MSIKKIQVTRKVEEIIKSYLYRGRYPTFQTITHHFSQWLREHTPGAPVFNPLKVFRKEKSSSSKYNHDIEGISLDINDAYESTISQTTQLMSDFNFIEVERDKLVHQLSSISKNIDELLLITDNADFRYFDGYIVGFEDAGDSNKEQSTAFINVKNKEVSLAENLSLSSQIIINPAKVSFNALQPSNKSAALESIKNAFDDNINTAWWHVIKTKELGADNIMRAELIVMLDNVEDINYIEYVPHHSKPIEAKIEYTTDGSTFSPVYQKAETDTITGIKIWNFQAVKATGIKFVFEKSDYDERNGDYYNYYFGAKNISIHTKNYVSQGMYYTNPLELSTDVHEVSMFAKNDIPFNTELLYEIASHDDSKSLEELIWHPISSFDETKPKYAKVVNLNTKENKKVETNKAEPTGEIINGMQVFRLMKDNGDGILSEKITDEETGETKENFDEFQNPKLFRGINQWKQERTYVKFDGKVPLNNKWDEQYLNRPDLIRTSYQNKSNQLDLRRLSGGLNDNFYRFSICIYSDEPRNEPLSLSVISSLSTGTRKRLGAYSVYLNKQRLAPVNDEVTMPFVKGWNEIQVLYHWGNMEERKDVDRKDLPLVAYLGKFNFAKEQRVRGDIDYMQYVDTHSLYHNISPNNRNYFSIYERQVVLNYLPENCVFQMIYESTKQAENQNKVVVRAHLNRDTSTPHVTPKIYSIRLRAK